MQLESVTLPPGLGVFLPAKVVMRDPEYFPDPDAFNPDRFLGMCSVSVSVYLKGKYKLVERQSYSIYNFLISIGLALKSHTRCLLG